MVKNLNRAVQPRVGLPVRWPSARVAPSPSLLIKINNINKIKNNILCVP
jgi:hypothetical protein